MERKITISQIAAKFTKDFDTFGKMDPFLSFKLGTVIQKTEVAKDVGNEPQWKASFTFKITDTTQIEITAYDEDVTQSQLMGTAKFQTKGLGASGLHKLTVNEADGNSVGQVTFKYEIKQQKAPQSSKNIENPVITSQKAEQASSKKLFLNELKITDITAKFTKNFDTFAKMEPFLVFKIGQSQNKTQIGSNETAEVTWVKNIELGYNDDKELQVKGYNQNLTEHQYIGMAVIPIAQLSKPGQHTMNLIGEDKESIGTVSFKFEIIGHSKTQQLPSSKKQIVQQSASKSIANSKPVEQPVNSNPTASQKNNQHAKSEKRIIEESKITQKPIQTSTLKSVQRPKAVQESSENPFKNRQQKQSEGQLNNSITNNESLVNKSLNKSRQTLRLPNIGDMSRNFGDRIYDKQSSATLQKSILVFSMPKAPRFGSGPKYAGQPSYYVDSCFKPNTTKGVGFGFGSKRQFPEWLEKNMKQNPAPGAYFQEPKITTVRSKGPTFGISHKFYEKVTIPRQKSPERVTKSNQRLKPIIRNN